MRDYIEKQNEFQLQFGRISTDIPQNIKPIDAVFRFHLMSEEVNEYLQAAVLQNDLTKVADALGDILYTVFGTINEHGLGDAIEEVFNEIHRSNMSKLFIDENGKKYFKNDANGKTIKPPYYSPPDIKAAVRRALNQ